MVHEYIYTYIYGSQRTTNWRRAIIGSQKKWWKKNAKFRRTAAVLLSSIGYLKDLKFVVFSYIHRTLIVSEEFPGGVIPSSRKTIERTTVPTIHSLLFLWDDDGPYVHAICFKNLDTPLKSTTTVWFSFEQRVLVVAHKSVHAPMNWWIHTSKLLLYRILQVGWALVVSFHTSNLPLKAWVKF